MIWVNKLFIRSLTEQSPIEIIYMAQHKQSTKRKIIVKKMNLDSIVAYCFLRKQFRTFRIEYILAVFPVKGFYERHSSHSN
jgi:predicted DNA-binding transcriptional regulator YafY